MATYPNPELDLEEQIARIRKMGAETEKALADIQKVRVDTDYAPRALGFQAMLATAALLGAGAALAKVFFP